MSIFSQQNITFVAIILISISHMIDGQLVYQYCYGDETAFSLSSNYGPNINESIAQLTSLASTSYYNTVSVGKGTNKVNALFSCRYDISSDDCQSCVAGTLENVPNCLQSVESIQYYQDCTVHYSNYTIFSLAEMQPWSTIYGVRNISDDGEFIKLLSKTVTSLISDALIGFAASSRYFATRTVKYSALETIYALAQCNKDITSSQCNKCLQFGFGNFSAIHPDSFLGQVFTPSCMLSYKLSKLPMSAPYNFSVVMIEDTPIDGPTSAPLSSPDDGSTPAPMSSLDEDSTPPVNSPIEELSPPATTTFPDVLTPPPSPPTGLFKSTGTRRMSTAVATFLIVLLYVGLLI